MAVFASDFEGRGRETIRTKRRENLSAVLNLYKYIFHMESMTNSKFAAQ